MKQRNYHAYVTATATDAGSRPGGPEPTPQASPPEERRLIDAFLSARRALVAAAAPVGTVRAFTTAAGEVPEQDRALGWGQ